MIEAGNLDAKRIMYWETLKGHASGVGAKLMTDGECFLATVNGEETPFGTLDEVSGFLQGVEVNYEEPMTGVGSHENHLDRGRYKHIVRP